MKRRIEVTMMLALLAFGFSVFPSRRAVATPDMSLPAPGIIVEDEVYAGKGRLFILSIGINDYLHLPKLVYAVPDAKALADSFERRGGGFTKINKTLLIDGEATKDKVEHALDSIAREVRPNDTFVFCFSGFGHVFGGGSGKEAAEVSTADFYLLPRDADKDAIPTTAISGRGLRSYFRRIRARNQLVVLDSCESSFGFASVASSVVEQDQTVSDLLKINSLFIGTDTLEFESKELQHGVITAAVLEALSGAGDYDKDGSITAREAEAYLYNRLRELSSKNRKGRDVHPQTITRGDDFFLGYSDTKLAAVSRAPINKDERTGNANAKAETNPAPEKTNSNSSKDTSARSRPTRSEPIEAPEPERAEVRKGTDYALLIATDEYQDKDDWRPLANPVADAEAIKERLISRYGFKPENVRLEKNPTRRQIFDVVREYKTRKFDKPKEDQLFIFFAGHGTVDKETGDGYLVASDSSGKLTDDCEGRMVQVETLIKLIDEIQCAHIFVAFDACYIGQMWKPRFKTVSQIALLNERPGDTIASPMMFQAVGWRLPEAGAMSTRFASLQGTQQEEVYARVSRNVYVKRKMNNRTRIIFTSGDRPVYDGEPGKHSPFARAFIEALDRGSNAKYGVLTTGEIYLNIDDLDPKPERGVLDGSDGDFLFIAPPREQIGRN